MAFKAKIHIIKYLFIQKAGSALTGANREDLISTLEDPTQEQGKCPERRLPGDRLCRLDLPPSRKWGEGGECHFLQA